MNINELTDETKSVMLARLMGWKTRRYVNHDEFLPVPPWAWQKNLYHERYMALAHHVLIWANEQEWFTREVREDIAYSFAFASDGVSWSLDEVLRLAIEAGMVEDK